jgi:hypothetical protein
MPAEGPYGSTQNWTWGYVSRYVAPVATTRLVMTYSSRVGGKQTMPANHSNEL